MLITVVQLPLYNPSTPNSVGDHVAHSGTSLPHYLSILQGLLSGDCLEELMQLGAADTRGYRVPISRRSMEDLVASMNREFHNGRS